MSNSDDKGKEEGAGGKPIVFDEWLKAQPDEIKTMLDGHTATLRSALDNEKEQRKSFEKQLRDTAKKADEGSELKKSLDELSAKYASQEQQASFYEEAHAAGVTNLKLAYLAAQQAELFDKKGNVNFEQLKKQFPELFTGAAKPPPGNGGQGTRSQTPPGHSMNDFIRKAAGRG